MKPEAPSTGHHISVHLLNQQQLATYRLDMSTVAARRAATAGWAELSPRPCMIQGSDKNRAPTTGTIQPITSSQFKKNPKHIFSQFSYQTFSNAHLPSDFDQGPALQQAVPASLTVANKSTAACSTVPPVASLDD
jgi:hypothetical protein